MHQFDYETYISKQAKRFRSKHYEDDLKQEGYLAYFEALNKGIEDHSRLETEIRKAMSSFVNFRNLPVTVPVTGDTYKTKTTVKEEHLTQISDTEKKLFYALQNTRVDSSDIDYYNEQDQEDKESYITLKNLWVEVLTEEEAQVIYMKVVEEYSYREISIKLGKSAQQCNNICKRGLDKLKEATSKE